MRFVVAKNVYSWRAAASDGQQQCYCLCTRSRDWHHRFSTWTGYTRFKSIWARPVAATTSSSVISVNTRIQPLSAPFISSLYCRSNSRFTETSQFRAHVSATESGPVITGRQEKELKKLKSDKQASAVFYDSLRVFVKGGMGGQGLPKNGGVGGKGGDIIAVGHKGVSLKKVSKLNADKRFVADPGADSKFFCLNGMPGKNIVLPVPLGVSVVTELGHKIGDINKHGEKLVVAKGGAGGSPSNGFSAENGQSCNVVLDLKLIADVGFVGFPNAGKSTLLKAISRASPKIASYPFTTVRPNIGVIEFPDFRQISLADLPGLIEGAHVNIGMGHKFLKHVERTKVLLFVVDIHGFQLSPNHPYRSAMETIVLLNKELELYKDELTEKPAILALNKSDLPGSYPIIQQIRKTLSEQSLYEKFLNTMPTEFLPENVLMFDEIIHISAKTDPISINELKKDIRQVIDSYADGCSELAITTS